MNWVQSLSKSIGYIEANLAKEMSIDDIARQACSSNQHFQLIFHVVMGVTAGEYIRYRRLSLAAQDLLKPEARIIDVAMQYQYDTQESFSKAFSRFHGVPPSKVTQQTAKLFHPLTINVTVQGGFDMTRKWTEEFYLANWQELDGQADIPAQDKYSRLTNWARKARGTNPSVFDALTQWILDDSQWTKDKIAENEQILIHGVLARFKEQNAQLRARLQELEPSGVVNPPVFKALDRFDALLMGNQIAEDINETVTKMFTSFSAMQERRVRELVAGGITGKAGVDAVDIFGYVNYLKDADASVQWALFMPDLVKHQQNGFQISSFEYKTNPAMRFIGQAYDPFKNDMQARKAIAHTLDAMGSYASGFDYDILLTHLYGKCVDSNNWHSIWGRFMQADTPVPEGFICLEFGTDDDEKQGLPYISRFAFATYSGDVNAMHKKDENDGVGMYVVTRNIILSQGVGIPYPNKYWTAEVFLDGYEKPSTGYLFSVVP
ncbi:MAG: helix-turn-helix domain-containing protein [Defluviitaleaceae bacterium]|nr:helix-turn-helix domain-containing protein [Defluviitaleaceae bacterium]